MTRLVSVDPGSTGALALFDGPRLVEVVDMPVVYVRRGKTDKAEVEGYALASLLRRWAPATGIIEQVGGIQGQSASAAFNFGRAAGAAEYAMTTLGLRVFRVVPQTWKKALGIRGGKDDSIAAATRLWPYAADRFKRKKDDGRAEAALIGWWFLQHNGGLNEPASGQGGVFG